MYGTHPQNMVIQSVWGKLLPAKYVRTHCSTINVSCGILFDRTHYSICKLWDANHACMSQLMFRPPNSKRTTIFYLWISVWECTHINNGKRNKNDYTLCIAYISCKLLANRMTAPIWGLWGCQWLSSTPRWGVAMRGHQLITAK